jgi:hypothetical protein
MARGDFTIFEEFADQLGEEKHNFASDTLKLGIIDNVATPTAADATPTWSDYSANEVSTAGGYTANGETLANVSWSEAAGVGTLDADDVELAQNGSGFTDGYWGIVYNDSEATDMAIGFVDLGGPVSEQDGPVNIRWNASGLFTVTVTP